MSKQRHLRSSLRFALPILALAASDAYAQNTCVAQAFHSSLSPPALSPDADYGASICLVGDTVIVGAPGHDAGRGAVVVHKYVAGSGFNAGVVLSSPPGLQPGDNFGYAVAFNGTFLAVGAPGRDLGGTDNGALYVYKKVVSQGVTSYPLIYSIDFNSPKTGNRYASALSYSGSRIAIGIPGYSTDDFPEQGAVAVHLPYGDWDGGGAGWSIYPPSPQAYEHFGASVVLDGDTLIAGSPDHDASASTPNSGRAVVFDNSTTYTQWNVISEFKFFTPIANRHLGASIAFNGGKIVIGAPGMATGANQFDGGALVFSKLPGFNTWSLEAELKPSVGAVGLGAGFGRGVAKSTSRIYVAGDDHVVEYKLENSTWKKWHEMKAPYADLDPQQPVKLGPTVAANDIFITVGRPSLDADDVGRLFPFWICGGTIGDLGGGTDGSKGAPRLGYAGPLVNSLPVEFSLIHGKPFATSILLVHLGAAGNLSWKGGTLFAAPFQTSIALPLDELGEIHAPSILPTGLSNLDLVLQSLVIDSAAQGGVALTNAVQLKMAP